MHTEAEHSSVTASVLVLSSQMRTKYKEGQTFSNFHINDEIKKNLLKYSCVKQFLVKHTVLSFQFILLPTTTTTAKWSPQRVITHWIYIHAVCSACNWWKLEFCLWSCLPLCKFWTLKTTISNNVRKNDINIWGKESLVTQTNGSN